MTYAFLACAIAVIAFPLVWVVLTAIKPPAEVLSYPPEFITSHPTLENFYALESQLHYTTFFINSTVVAVSAVCLSVLLGIPVAYAMCRFVFTGRKLILHITMLMYMIPPILLGIPLFLMFSYLKLSNTYIGLILAHFSFCFPFSLWMLISIFQSIPTFYEEQAMVDGCSRFEAVRRTLLPLSLPGIVAVAFFTFAVSWNDYLFALLLVSSENLKTLPLLMTSITTFEMVYWGQFMAGTVLMTLPPIFAFLFVQKYLVKGFAVGL